MKKYRCPCCGEECITLSNKIFCYQASNGKNAWVDISGNRCPECGEIFKIFPQPCIRLYIEVAIVILFLLFMIYLIAFVNSLYSLLVLLFAFLYPMVIAPLLSINLPIVKYSRKDKKFIVPESNAKLMLKDPVAKFNHLDIYGLQFHLKTKNVKFHETFTNGLVPVVFHKNGREQQAELKVTIIKTEFIPKELLFEGSEFTVIDNGKEFATGKITKVYGE